MEAIGISVKDVTLGILSAERRSTDPLDLTRATGRPVTGSTDQSIRFRHVTPVKVIAVGTGIVGHSRYGTPSHA